MAEHDGGEQVLVVPREALADLLEGDDGRPLCGFRPGGLSAVHERIGKTGCFRPRALVEEDPSFKQPIPYGLLFHEDQVFVMERTRAGGDARLHDRVSLGVGGHVNPCDATGQPLEHAPGRALHRELGEELDVRCEYRASLWGLLNDESNAVGQVHVGLVYGIEVLSREVSVREQDLLRGEFRARTALADLVPRMETWSEILHRHWTSGARSPWDVRPTRAEQETAG